jgi:hypothetical protein
MKSRDLNLTGAVQIKVYTALEQLGAATAKDIAAHAGLTELQVVGAVDRFIEIERAYVMEWRVASGRSAARVFKLGRGANAPRVQSNKVEARTPKGDMHLLDYRQQHLEHQKFMQNFKPHPDVAAAWLLNPIQGESA